MMKRFVMIERRTTELRPAQLGRTLHFVHAVLCILVVGLTPTVVQAAFPPAFVVVDVPVDVTVNGGNSARDLARGQGQATAIRRLFQRLTGQSDWGHLPSLDQQTITGLLSDYEVLEEHSTAERYVASYVFRFNPKGIRQILTDAGVPFSELVSKQVIIVPVLQFSDSTPPHSDSDPWRDAWISVPGKYGVVPWVTPPPDQAILALADPANSPPKPDQIQALSHRYDDSDVVVVTATQSTAPSGVHLDIAIAHYTPDGSVQTAATKVDGAKASPTLYHAGLAASVVELENQWKAISFAGASAPPTPFQVSVPIARAADWGAIRDRLGRVSVVRSASVEAMTRHDIRLTLMVTADPAMLKVALAQQNLALDQSGVVQSLTLRSADSSLPSDTH